ncbi:unnamed protein product [Coregonus sp. 'balchen']|nr:unnamed protein product [Coregonus sp. 'balchen']
MIYFLMIYFLMIYFLMIYFLMISFCQESRRDCLDLEASVLMFRAEKRQQSNGNKPLCSTASSPFSGATASSSSSSLALELHSKPLSPRFLDNTARVQRRLSHPAELELKKTAAGAGGRSQTKLSLNPIYRQVPRLVERCCCHIERHVLRGTDQFQYLQLMLYLLPACNCDTLLRLLTLLHTVQSHAEDTTGPQDQVFPGNKMTATNLAVIFGPNLLQGERGGGDREMSPHAMGIEDSTAIINVTLHLIQNYRRLFTVSAELQQEPPSPLFNPDGPGDGSLTSEMRPFHSHHNLLSLAQPSSSSRVHPEDSHLQAQEQRAPLGEDLSFTLGAASCSSLGGQGDNSVWVRQTSQEEREKPSPSHSSYFWDFFTGKGSESETMV